MFITQRQENIIDSSMCNNCLTLSQKSWLYVFVGATLTLASVQAFAIQLQEQSCEPRPVVVGDQTEGFKPYHVLLHRCSGTCDDINPERKPCIPSTTESIDVKVHDPLNGNDKIIKVLNHTSCDCECNLDCDLDNGQVPDGDQCICKPVSQPSGRKPDIEDILPYKIGLCVTSAVAFCALVFGMIMYARRKNILKKVKQPCCKGKGQEDNTV